MARKPQRGRTQSSDALRDLYSRMGPGIADNVAKRAGFEGSEDFFADNDAKFDRQTRIDDAIGSITRGLGKPHTQTDIRQPTRHYTEPSESDLNRGIEPTPFVSGGKAQNEDLQKHLDTLRELDPGKANLYETLTGGKIKQNEERESFRSTLVGSSNSAQRSVRAINQAVFTGRRKRRGSNVSLPKIALAGLNKNV